MAGIELIEKQDREAFYQYCEETENTICGRHPIGILLAMLKAQTSGSYQAELVAYDQSEKVLNEEQSSVSYASMLVTQ